MAKRTIIHWADSTVNPVMGCDGCPLSPPTAKVASNLKAKLVKCGIHEKKAKEAVDAAFGTETLTTLYYRRKTVAEEIVKSLTAASVKKAGWDQVRLEKYISNSVRCYAHVLHLRYGPNPDQPDKKVNPGLATMFEKPKMSPDRCLERMFRG